MGKWKKTFQRYRLAEVNLGPLFAYGRYVWGFSDISNALKEKATTQQIQVGVGVRF